MKLLNKSLALFLSVVMLFSLVGCSLDSSNYTNSSSGYQTESSSSIEDSSNKTEQSSTDQTESPSTTTNSNSQTESPTTTSKPTENTNNSTGVGTGTAPLLIRLHFLLTAEQLIPLSMAINPTLVPRSLPPRAMRNTQALTAVEDVVLPLLLVVKRSCQAQTKNEVV